MYTQSNQEFVARQSQPGSCLHGAHLNRSCKINTFLMILPSSEMFRSSCSLIPTCRVQSTSPGLPLTFVSTMSLSLSITVSLFVSLCLSVCIYTYMLYNTDMCVYVHSYHFLIISLISSLHYHFPTFYSESLQSHSRFHVSCNGLAITHNCIPPQIIHEALH